MLVHENKLPAEYSNLCSSYIEQHIRGIMEASPTSHFYGDDLDEISKKYD
jgi:hypothetical protein